MPFFDEWDTTAGSSHALFVNLPFPNLIGQSFVHDPPDELTVPKTPRPSVSVPKSLWGTSYLQNITSAESGYRQ